MTELDIIVPAKPRISVVIPCFRGGSATGAVIRAVGGEVERIFVVDDGCPEATGDRLIAECADPRLVVLHNGTNLGVGGAMKRGYAAALAAGADIVVKLDADGQMDPAFIPLLTAPLAAGTADYVKGNRFAAPAALPPAALAPALGRMPPLRRAANLLLSHVHKGVTGYWGVADPANGFTAIAAPALRAIELDRLADCYFFETDMLFQLGRVDARVAEVPLPARYGEEVSSLSLRRALMQFPRLGLHRFGRRIAFMLQPRVLRPPTLAEQGAANL